MEEKEVSEHSDSIEGALERRFEDNPAAERMEVSESD